MPLPDSEAIARARSFVILLGIAEDEDQSVDDRVMACNVILEHTSLIDVTICEPTEV